MAKDLSKVAGNPTSALQDRYHDLMAVQDPEELKRLAIEIVQPFLGHSLSEKNYRMFMHTMSKLRSIHDVQKYLTNYILKGSGLGVVRDSVEYFAGTISEDIDFRPAMTESQLELKALVEQYGFKVVTLPVR